MALPGLAGPGLYSQVKFYTLYGMVELSELDFTFFSFQVFLQTTNQYECSVAWNGEESYLLNGDFCAVTDIAGITKDPCQVSFCFNFFSSLL